MELVNISDLGNIQQKRKDAGLTQYKVASYCGISLQTLRSWEYGTTKSIKPEHYKKLSEILNNA